MNKISPISKKVFCGLDIHKSSVTACIIDQNNENVIKSFGSTTQDLLLLKSWLNKFGVTDIAMESTGSYWRPIFNVSNMVKSTIFQMVNDLSL